MKTTARDWMRCVARCVLGVAAVIGFPDFEPRAAGQALEVVWSDDFEGDPASTRWVTAPPWQIGVPSSGPGSAHSGSGCAATILDGNYPPNVSHVRFESPSITIPVKGRDPQLRFFHWLDCELNQDWAFVDIQEVGGAWSQLAQFSGPSRRWSEQRIDLAAYAGKRVRFAFRFFSNGTNQGPGWYVDDVQVVFPPSATLLPGVVETFEGGLGAWTVDNGVWMAEAPSATPPMEVRGRKTLSGVTAVGTGLGTGAYPPNTDTRLVSPKFVVPGAKDRPRLSFWHWYSILGGGKDTAYVVARVVGSAKWELTDGRLYTGESLVWARASVDLTKFAGKEIQVGFRQISGDRVSGAGWTVDDIVLETGVPTRVFPENFDGEWAEWQAAFGGWDRVEASAVPGREGRGGHLAGVRFAGSLQAGLDSTLVSPEFVVPPSSELPRLRFWHAHAFAANGEHGSVTITDLDRGSTTTLGVFWRGTLGWYRPTLDLGAFAGARVRVGFRIQLGRGSDSKETKGWYLDDLELETGLPGLPFPEPLDRESTAWANDQGGWGYGWSGGRVCLGVGFDGAYAGSLDTRYSSPFFLVPISPAPARLRFDHRFSLSRTTDRATVEVRSPGQSGWQVLATYTGYSGGWTRPSLGLEALAGKVIQIAFRVTTGDGLGSGGWFVSDLRLLTEPVRPLKVGVIEGFENGWNGWHVDAGGWDVGRPGIPPPADAEQRVVFSGNACADGAQGRSSYMPGLNTRLISPPVRVPQGNMNPRLRFRHWFRFAARDAGAVEVRLVGTNSWLVLAAYEGQADSWGHAWVDLRSLAGSEVQFAFRMTSDGSDQGPGWFIDDVVVEEGPVTFRNPEGFEQGDGEWITEHGIWESGRPSVMGGPGAAFQGQACFGTFAQGGFAADAVASLFSPRFVVPPADWEPALRFWHWYDLEEGLAKGSVWLRVVDEGRVGAYGPWTEMTASQGYTGAGRFWTQPRFDLSAYAGKVVQLAFQVRAGKTPGRTGWYLDEVRIETGVLPSLARQVIEEGKNLHVSLADFPSGRELLFQGPPGMRLDPVLNSLDWVPGECQGPSTNLVTVGFLVAGNPLEPAAITSFSVTVTESNEAPVLDPLPDRTIAAGRLLEFDAAAFDPDCPAQALVYSLDAGAPSGATIDPVTGRFRWMPRSEQATHSHSISVRVTDSWLGATRSANRAFVASPEPASHGPSLVIRRSTTGAMEMVVGSFDGPRRGRIQRAGELSSDAGGGLAWEDRYEGVFGPEPVVWIDSEAGSRTTSFYRLSFP